MRRLHRFFCQGWHAITAQTLLWVALAMTSGLLLGSVRHEGDIREEQLCGVVINVHTNAQFRAATEKDNLDRTLEYLHDPESKKDAPALYRRVQDAVEVSQRRKAEADANVTATRIPPVCKKYEHS